MLDALPESIRKLPGFEYRQRAATTASEFFSDVEYAVETPSDIKERSERRARKKK